MTSKKTTLENAFLNREFRFIFYPRKSTNTELKTKAYGISSGQFDKHLGKDRAEKLRSKALSLKSDSGIVRFRDFGVIYIYPRLKY